MAGLTAFPSIQMRCCEHRPQTVIAPPTDDFCTAYIQSFHHQPLLFGGRCEDALRDRGFRVVPYNEKREQWRRERDYSSLLRNSRRWKSKQWFEMHFFLCQLTKHWVRFYPYPDCPPPPHKNQFHLRTKALKTFFCIMSHLMSINVQVHHLHFMSSSCLVLPGLWI